MLFTTYIDRLIAALCKRCRKPFMYLRPSGRAGRNRYFCPRCKELEQQDRNDDRRRKTTRRRRTHWTRRLPHAGEAVALACRVEAVDANPA